MSYHITDSKLTKKDMQEYCRTDPQDLAMAIREAEDLVTFAKIAQKFLNCDPDMYLPSQYAKDLINEVEKIIKAHADKWPSEDEL